MSKTVPFQAIQFSICTQYKYSFYFILFQVIQFSQTVLNETIAFSISMQFSSI